MSSKHLFGAPLEIAIARSPLSSKLPLPVVRCIERLSTEEGFCVYGIFRIPGKVNIVNELIKLYNDGNFLTQISFKLLYR